ncbi:hypothetical protein [Streptomyces platensis]|uniref:hypothetical protein n=1 Tax=Streptomyces platensis TaxID=58346 RepID=UPI002E807473|nr:hypothetical protein [Streptomyces platensis]WUB77811.1 hypothetical protein OG424_00540 [Streptomyces platensis]
MGRISEEPRKQKEDAIRASMDRLLRGELPSGGKFDLSTLAAEAGVTRTAFYPKKNRDGTVRPGPYQHLAEEFERRLKLLQEAGTVVDPRAAQIQRLKDKNAKLEERLVIQNAELDELNEFKQLALSRIAAQHLEIERLRAEKAAGDKVATLVPRRPVTGTISSCS